MRKLAVWMQMSLDGYASGPEGAFDWPVVTDDLTNYWLELAGEIDTEGRLRARAPTSCATSR